MAQSSSAALPQTPTDPHIGWQAGSTRRGTWDIIISCLVTIFAATWSVQHLNIPGPSDGTLIKFLRSTKWMIITVLFPEFIILHGVLELTMALEALRKFHSRADAFVKLPYWLRIIWKPPTPSDRGSGGDQENPNSHEDSGPEWTLTHCFFANMGGMYVSSGSGSYSKFHDSDYQDRTLLTAIQMANTVNDFERPEITEDDINDISKSDLFAKGIATFQFLRLLLTLVARTNQHLAFSQLETVTLGFAVCGAVIYIIYLSKPQNVSTAVQVLNIQRRLGHVSDDQPSEFPKTYDSFWNILMNDSKDQPSQDATFDNSDDGNSSSGDCRIPNDNVPVSNNQISHPGVVLLAALSGAFGALHAIAWNFEFPSFIELQIWRVAIVVSIASPMLGLVMLPFTQATIQSGDPREFMRNCLSLLREASWSSENSISAIARRAYDRLEAAYGEADRGGTAALQPYWIIFGSDDNSFELHEQFPELAQGPDRSILLAECLLLLLKSERDSEMHKRLFPNQRATSLGTEFVQQFTSLVEILGGNFAKKLQAEARTNVFPRRPLFSRSFNHGVLILTMALYCLSRLAILAVALSSLRSMPDSVYAEVRWTQYIPSFGSS